MVLNIDLILFISASLLALIFLSLGSLHVYWAIGGRKWLAAAIPEVNGKAAFQPGAAGALIVAIGLFGFGGLAVLLWGMEPKLQALEIGGWLAVGIFSLRAIGDFRYLGFFKTIRGSAFARKDSRIYAPLCLGIAVLFTLLLTL